jgi:acyl-CoA synthetase (AMP-forming)/AMP-acid ligase II
MRCLAQQLAAHDTSVAILGSSGRQISRSQLRRVGVSDAVGPSARIALKLRDPLDLLTVLTALDGQVEAILLLSYALAQETAIDLARAARCTIFVADEFDGSVDGITPMPLVDVLGSHRQEAPVVTQWLMTTSGTTGLPKIVPHTLQSLARSVYRFKAEDHPTWGLLYDPTRFAGLQVVLQALIGGGQLVAIDTTTALSDQITALVHHSCTHLSATPTLWRRLMMVPGHARLPLRQATLGGEIADQMTLNAVRAAFPAARLSHIYASTEAGVGFSVTDGVAGFPRSYLETALGNVRLQIRDDILWLRPPMTALVPGSPHVEIDAEGYVRSGDQVRFGDGRVQFLGRENGMINIGGVKVYPETVEAVVKTVPGVALVQVSSKRSPVTGALVLAEVQLESGVEPDVIRSLIQEACRAQLDREAVPAIIRFVENFKINAAGKLIRTGA